MILGESLAVLTAACFATASSVWSYTGKKIGSNSVTHIRLWLSLPAIIVVHYVFTGFFFPFHIDSRALLLFLVSGAFGFAVADLFIFRSLVLIGVRETLVILTLSPIFGTIISWFFLGERLSFLQITGITITICGVMWVIYEEGQNRKRAKKKKNLGIPFALAGALAQALANMLSKGALLQGIHPITGTYVRITAGLFTVALFSMVRRSFLQDIQKMAQLKTTALLSFGTMVGPIMGVIVSLYALSMAPVGVVSALMQLSPIILLPFDYFILKKPITYRVVLGTFIAIGGAALLFIH